MAIDMVAFLLRVRSAPEMFVGFDHGNECSRLERLEYLAYGYQAAIYDQWAGRRQSGFLHELSEYVANSRGWPMDAGVFSAITSRYEKSSDSWAEFWKIFDEFLAAREG